MLRRLKPQQLKNRMMKIVKWRKDEGFDKKDFNRFMREVATQEKKLQEEKSAFEPSFMNESGAEAEKRDPPKKYQRAFAKRAPTGRTYGNASQAVGSKWNTTNTTSNKTGTKRKREENNGLPPCLNPKCDGHHFIQQCDKSDEATKTDCGNNTVLLKKLV